MLSRIETDMKRMCLLILLLCSRILYADIIHLKDGSKFDGFFLSMEGEYFLFQTASGEKRVQADSIDRLEIGYSGVPVCFVESGRKECPGVLHALNSDRMVIGKGRGFLERESIALGDVSFIEFQKERENQKVLPVLSSGIKIHFLLEESKVSGKIRDIRNEQAVFQDEDAVSVKEGDIHGGLFAAPMMELSEGLRFFHIVPGWHQFRRGDTMRGFSILGGLFALGLGLYSEYASGEAVVKQAAGAPEVMLFNFSDGYKARFDSHQAQHDGCGDQCLPHFESLVSKDFPPAIGADEIGLGRKEQDRYRIC